MNTARIAVAAAALLLTAAPAWAQMYKCSDNTGKVSYQQHPCQGSARETTIRADNPAPSQGQSDSPIEIGKKTCRENVPVGIFKDPESVRIESIVGGRMDAIEYEGTHLAARIFYLSINAKNSYGAYAGAKTYVCTTDQTGARILKFSDGL